MKITSICSKTFTRGRRKRYRKAAAKHFALHSNANRKTTQSIAKLFALYANAEIYLPNVPKNLRRKNLFNGRNFCDI